MVDFNNMDNLLQHYYGGFGVKKDAPVLTTTTGVYNPVFGAFAFNQINMEANAFALLPKYPWPHSGFRAITADPSSSDYGAVAENGNIPATIKPTFAEITVTTKQVVHSFDVSYIQEGKVNKSADDAIGDMEFLRGYFATFHGKDINRQILIDGDTLATNKFESIDRVTASSAYATAVGWTAGDEDIYGIDRSGAAWADAYVNHNSGVDRFLTDEIIRTSFSNLETNGAATNLMLTGNDTKWKIFGIYENQVRYQGVLQKNVGFTIGINGVETDGGMGAGVRVATVYGTPLFSTQSAAQDTISRIYMLDTTEEAGSGRPRLGISLMYPTLYFESGMSAANPNPFAIGRFGTEGVYYTAGELVCTFLAAQGSIRDLK